MNDFDQRARKIAWAQKLIVGALRDVQGIKQDAAGWDAPDVVETAEAAFIRLDELNDALDDAYAALPPPTAQETP